MLLKQNSCHLDGSSCLLFFIYFPGLLDKGRFNVAFGALERVKKGYVIPRERSDRGNPFP